MAAMLYGITVNPVFKVATGLIRKWLDKNAKVRGATFITGFGRGDQLPQPTDWGNLETNLSLQSAIRVCDTH